jgi:DNA-binding Lrp family transcriptional regulator
MLKIDLRDKKILYALDRDSRQSNKQIAKKVGLSEQVVGKRIKRLQHLGVIENFFVKINPSVLDYMHLKIYLRLHNIKNQQEKELFNYLNQCKNVYWLASLRGKYDLVISIYLKNISDFSNIYEDLFGKWQEFILERNIIVLERAFSYTKAHLIPKQKSEQIIYGVPNEKKIKLDQINIKLLKILNTKGREPLIDLAKELKVSADTVKYRLNNLKKKGVITGFGTKINYRRLDYHYQLVFLKLQQMTLQKYKKLEFLSKINENVIVFIKTIGDHDIELEIETKDTTELDKLIKVLRDNFVTEIKDYEILEVTKEHRMTYFPF